MPPGPKGVRRHRRRTHGTGAFPGLLFPVLFFLFLVIFFVVVVLDFGCLKHGQ
jgi:hypothetical protein